MHVRRKLSKEERLALVKAGREERGKYQARAAVKQKKVCAYSSFMSFFFSCVNFRKLAIDSSIRFSLDLWAFCIYWFIFSAYSCIYLVKITNSINLSDYIKKSK